MHPALGIEGYVPSSLREIRNMCNTPNRQRLRFVDEYLIPIQMKVEDKYVLRYYVSKWLRDFFFDPNRSRYLYSTSLVIEKCQKAIKNLILDSNPDLHTGNNNDLICFFMPTPAPSGEIPIANAIRLLESARNGSDRNELLLFLEHLSGIHWFDIYHSGWGQRQLTNGIVHWVCTTLVG
jgi:hypothetical protein